MSFIFKNDTIFDGKISLEYFGFFHRKEVVTKAEK